MATDTSTAGYLVPVTTPAEGDPLDDLLQESVVGMTGLPGTHVRPRWPAGTALPQRPEPEEDWCSFGIKNVDEDVFAYEGVDPANSEQDVIQRDEIITVLFSFYGPHSMERAKEFSVGMQLSQNRESLRAADIALVEVQSIVVVPVLLAQKWQRRVDMNVVYRRRATWTYAVRKVVDVSGIGLDNEIYVTPIVVEPPGP